MIPPDVIEQVKKIDLVSLIGKHIELKKRGRDYWACCPFHQEKTPSFHITPEKGMYFCMGCRAGGTAIDWMINYHGMRMIDAVKALAAEMNIPFEEVKETLAPKKFKKLVITREKKEDSKVAFVDKDRATAALILECKRNDGLKKWFESKGIRRLHVSSLAATGEIGWWGGRLVYFYPDGAIKIRESLESSRTSRWVKGSAEECWQSSNLDRCPGGIWMFEGETDCMRSDPYVPSDNWCISMPSASWAPTPEQCYRIGAFREVTLCFDGDRAGREATKRIAALLKKHANGCKVYDLQMPDGMDCCKLNDEQLKKLIDRKIELR